MEQLPLYRTQSTGTDSYWQEGPLIFTDGIKAMVEELEAFWILDVVRSYLAQLSAYEFLVVYFDVFDNQTCLFHAKPDSDLPDIVSQQIDYTDLKASLAMYLIGGVLLMREEY